MLNAPGWLWLIIFVVSYEIGKVLAARVWDHFTESRDNG